MLPCCCCYQIFGSMPTEKAKKKQSLIIGKEIFLIYDELSSSFRCVRVSSLCEKEIKMRKFSIYEEQYESGNVNNVSLLLHSFSDSLTPQLCCLNDNIGIMIKKKMFSVLLMS